MKDIVAAVVNRLKANSTVFLQVQMPLQAGVDFATTAPSTTTVTMKTDQTGRLAPGNAIGLTVSGVLVFTYVKSITATLLTLYDAVLVTTPSALTGIGIARVYADNLPPGCGKPAIAVIRPTATRPEQNSSGAYTVARVQCTSFATSGGAAAQLDETVADALNLTVNTLLPQDPSLAPVAVVRIEDLTALPDNSDALLRGEYRVHHDFVVEYLYKG